MEFFKKILPEKIYDTLESNDLLTVIYDAVKQDIDINGNAHAMQEKYKAYKPEMSVLTDGTYRRTIKGKLGLSQREFIMVEPNSEDKTYNTTMEMIADCVLTIARDKNDPKYKEEPIIDFTQDTYVVAPKLKLQFLQSLGVGEVAPLHFMLGYFGFLQQEFFRTW